MKIDDKWSPYKVRCKQGQLSFLFFRYVEFGKTSHYTKNIFILFVYLIKVTKRLKCKYVKIWIELVIIPWIQVWARSPSPCKQNLFLRYICLIRIIAKRNKRGSARRVGAHGILNFSGSSFCSFIKSVI